ncbi:unnamed protein product, partial [Lymnaea stagnalis]
SANPGTPQAKEFHPGKSYSNNSEQKTVKPEVCDSVGCHSDSDEVGSFGFNSEQKQNYRQYVNKGIKNVSTVRDIREAATDYTGNDGDDEPSPSFVGKLKIQHCDEPSPSYGGQCDESDSNSGMSEASNHSNFQNGSDSLKGCGSLQADCQRNKDHSLDPPEETDGSKVNCLFSDTRQCDGVDIPTRVRPGSEKDRLENKENKSQIEDSVVGEVKVKAEDNFETDDKTEAAHLKMSSPNSKNYVRREKSRCNGEEDFSKSGQRLQTQEALSESHSGTPRSKPGEADVLKSGTSSGESGQELSPSVCDSSGASSPVSAKCVPESNGLSDRSKAKGQSVKGEHRHKKQSALDSLSSFVYSQPLTSEHPLDSLQRLLSTNDLTQLPH